MSRMRTRLFARPSSLTRAGLVERVDQMDRVNQTALGEFWLAARGLAISSFAFGLGGVSECRLMKQG